MNSVHEPGSRTMSKNLTQEKYQVKSGQKQVECTECTALGQPARPCRALPRACRAPAPPLRPALTRPAACSARPRAPRMLACTIRALPTRPTPAQPAPSAVSWPGWPCRSLVSRHSPAAHCPCCHNTTFVLQYKFSQPAFLSQYNTVLQYNSTLISAILALLKPPYCNTI